MELIPYDQFLKNVKQTLRSGAFKYTSPDGKYHIICSYFGARYSDKKPKLRYIKYNLVCVESTLDGEIDAAGDGGKNFVLENFRDFKFCDKYPLHKFIRFLYANYQWQPSYTVKEWVQ